MSLLISVQGISKSYGSRNLFDQLFFSIHEGEKRGLAGPNGAGKSTLFRILAGVEKQDCGTISKRQGLKISYVSQSPEFTQGTAEEVLVNTRKDLPAEEALFKARILLGKVGFVDPSAEAATLSGGWKKRLAIASAFMEEPDLLLLDEPTNHLDLEGILWLEKFLQKEKTTYLLISHDRYFLENMCSEMAELNRCFPKGIFSVAGSWSTFEEKKEGFLLGQQRQERSLAGVVREEVAWMKKSPKARTTKAKSRVEKTENQMAQLQELEQRNKKRTVDIDFFASERETRNLIVAKNVGKSLGNKELFTGIDIKLSPGTRLGVIGKNGTGKTTLLKILAGEISQDVGTVKYAQDIKVVYFDQHRESINLDNTLREALSPSGDFIRFRGQEIHVQGWAKKFLFTPDLLNLPVRCLSGGERARILLARLMLQPADVLFLDEPTNDLDIPTLEVLENSLLEFPGAVVLITHDRCLMDRVCNQVIALGKEWEGRIFTDYTQWEKASKEKEQQELGSIQKSKPITPKTKSPLSYAEKKELEGIESVISKQEKKIAEIQEKTALNNSFNLYKEMDVEHQKLESLYERWQFLLDKQS